jgi:hypothetical protein
MDAGQKMIVCIAFPTWLKTREKLSPGIVIRVRIELKRLLDEYVPFLSLVFDEGRLRRSQARFHPNDPVFMVTPQESRDRSAYNHRTRVENNTGGKELMKPKVGLAAIVFTLAVTGCISIGSDAGPAKTANEEIDAGKAEIVRTDIRMGGGDLHISGGSAKLMAGEFRYSENVGRPEVQYEVTGSRGRLTVKSPNSNSASLAKKINSWDLRMGSATPLEINVNLGGGDADLDLSELPLESADINTGAGNMKLNLAGKYKKDVTVEVQGGAGNTSIRLPKDMGAVVKATLGIGSIDAGALTQRDGKYYNSAYAEGKPAVHVNVRGGVGDIRLSE